MSTEIDVQLLRTLHRILRQRSDLNERIRQGPGKIATAKRAEGEFLASLEQARELFDTIDPSTGPIQEPLQATASFEDLRWFLLPDEVRSGE